MNTNQTKETVMARLRDVQDVGVNYYVLVPFTTAGAALRAAGEIGAMFDRHVIGIADVNQDAHLIEEKP